jgi:Sulfotransferase domain
MSTATRNVSSLYRSNLGALSENDVVIASYGGSGQALIGNILAEAGLNYADPYTEVLRPDGSTMSPAFTSFRRRLAALHERDTVGGSPQPGPRFVKTHHLPEVHEGCRFDAVWLLVRDPRDALYSWYRWRLDFAEEPWDHVDGSFDDFLRGPDHTGRSPVDDWCAFYAEWGRRAGLVLRFEDLKERPLETVREALATLGLEAGDDTLRRAIERSTFDSMRRHEERVAGAGEGRLMRAGKVAGWRDWMTPELARHFSGAELRAVAKRFGYLIERSTPR